MPSRFVIGHNIELLFYLDIRFEKEKGLWTLNSWIYGLLLKHGPNIEILAYSSDKPNGDI